MITQTQANPNSSATTKCLRCGKTTFVDIAIGQTKVEAMRSI